MELKEMIKVMQHYENGGEVEASYKNKQDWLGVGSPSWDWDKFDYRIKGQKVTIEKWLLEDTSSGEYLIMESSDVDLYLKYALKWKKVKLLKTYEVEL